MASTGLKIVKEGRNITSRNPEDFVFSSNYPTFQIKERGSFEVTTSGMYFPTEVDYTHGFGYVPHFMCFTTSYMSDADPTKWGFTDYINLDVNIYNVTLGGFIYEELKASVDDDILRVSAYIETSVSAPVHTYTIDYILFMEEAELTSVGGI